MKSFIGTLLFLLHFTVTADEPACEPCLFNTRPQREGDDCSVYSVYDKTLQAWYRANETCLGVLNISQAAVPKDRMWGICPFANENEASNTLLSLFVRNTDSPASQAVRVMYPDFFNNETFDLNPSVPGTQGQIVNCTVSVNLCWNEFGILFDFYPEELSKVCAQLHVIQKASLIQEQAAAREALCGLLQNETGTDDLQVCQPLLQQIKDLSVSTCESVGRFDYGAFLPPNCTAASSNSSGASSSLGMKMLALPLVMVLFY